MLSEAGQDVLPLARPDLGEPEITMAARALRSGWLGRGPITAEFERALSDRLGAPHVVAVSTGTAALQLAVECTGIGVGDEVIVPSLTFCATYQAIDAAGALPVFADVDPATLCLDPDDVRRRVTPATRAIMAVHLCGAAASRAELAAVAAEEGVVLIEDAAHAFGSQVSSAEGDRWVPVGSTGNPVCFSFDPIKSLTCGQGGAVALADPALAAAIRVRSDLGLDGGEGSVSSVTGPGYRYAMSDLNAAIGLAQLAAFDEVAERRRGLLRRYRERLDGVSSVTVPEHDPEHMVPFTFMVRVPAHRRAHVRAVLASEGIGTGLHYPPGHLQPRYCGGPELPVTEQVAQELLTLPFFPSMADQDADRVAQALERAVTA